MPSRRQLSETGDRFCGHNWGWVGDPGTWWVEDRDNAKHLTMHRPDSPSQQRMIGPSMSGVLRYYPNLKATGIVGSEFPGGRLKNLHFFFTSCRCTLFLVDSHCFRGFYL